MTWRDTDHQSAHETQILPGARVRTLQGILGVVERLEHGSEAEDSRYLIVRSQQGDRHYRFPLQLVGTVGEETDQSVAYMVVRVDVPPDGVERYLIDAQAPWSEVDDREVEGDDAVVRLPLLAERLIAQTRPVLRGTIHLHKGVESEEQTLTLPVMHEEATVERIPADQYDPNAPLDPDDTIIPVIEERLVVEMRPVITEYIRIRKRRVTQPQEVRGTVRREVVSLSEHSHQGAPQAESPLLREL